MQGCVIDERSLWYPRRENLTRTLCLDRRSPGVMAQDMFVFNTALTSLELVDFERPCGFEQLVGLKVRLLH